MIHATLQLLLYALLAGFSALAFAATLAVMQAGPALRESVVQVINAVWYILVYGTAAVLLLAQTDWRLALERISPHR